MVPSPPPFPIQRMDPFIFMMHCILNTPNPQVFALHGQCIAFSCKLAVLQIASNLNSIIPTNLTHTKLYPPLNTYQYVSAASSSIGTKVDCCMLTCLLVDIVECRDENLHKKFVDVC